MADGTRKQIKWLTPGDMVLATDPETGVQGAREILTVFVHEDEMGSLALSDGTRITTTEDHPFWNQTDREFQHADALDFGDLVLSASGTTATVIGFDASTTATGLAYNLEIEGIHTYHVSGEGWLVHNTCTGGVLGGTVTKPKVSHPKLQNYVDHLYNAHNKLGKTGNGTTMDALRFENATGLLVRGSSHEQKAKEIRNGLKKWIQRNPGTSVQDRTVANSLYAESREVLRK